MHRNIPSFEFVFFLFCFVLCQLKLLFIGTFVTKDFMSSFCFCFFVLLPTLAFSQQTFELIDYLINFFRINMKTKVMLGQGQGFKLLIYELIISNGLALRANYAIKLKRVSGEVWVRTLPNFIYKAKNDIIFSMTYSN